MYNYADRECKDCHIVLPANVMVERSGAAVTGQSSSVSRPGNFSFDPAQQTHTTTTHTQNFVYHLCGACDERRRRDHERRRKATRRAILLTFLIGSLLLVAAVRGTFVSSASDDSTSNLPEAQFENTENDYLTLTDDSAAQSETPVAGPSAKFDNSAEAINEHVAAAATQLWPDISAGVDAQIELALEGGSTQQWSWRGMHGDVIVSSASETVSGPCRSFYLRLFTTQDAQQSPNQVRCYSAASGRWAAK